MFDELVKVDSKSWELDFVTAAELANALVSEMETTPEVALADSSALITLDTRLADGSDATGDPSNEELKDSEEGFEIALVTRAERVARPTILLDLAEERPTSGCLLLLEIANREAVVLIGVLLPYDRLSKLLVWEPDETVEILDKSLTVELLIFCELDSNNDVAYEC